MQPFYNHNPFSCQVIFSYCKAVMSQYWLHVLFLIRRVVLAEAGHMLNFYSSITKDLLFSSPNLGCWYPLANSWFFIYRLYYLRFCRRLRFKLAQIPTLLCLNKKCEAALLREKERMDKHRKWQTNEWTSKRQKSIFSKQEFHQTTKADSNYMNTFCSNIIQLKAD